MSEERQPENFIKAELMKRTWEDLIRYSETPLPQSITVEIKYDGHIYRGMAQLIDDEDREPIPEHDGRLGDNHYVKHHYRTVEIRGDQAEFAGLTPKQALSLLDWLTQEKSKLEALAKEQAE